MSEFYNLALESPYAEKNKIDGKYLADRAKQFKFADFDQNARAYDDTPKTLNMKVEFRKISSWKPLEKNYSRPIFFNGFFFYFFTRIENKDGNEYLGGYIRCTNPATHRNLIYLPLTITISVVLNSRNPYAGELEYRIGNTNSTRTARYNPKFKSLMFEPILAVFDNSDRSFGIRISQTNETLESIIKGTSSFVTDGKLTFLIQLSTRSLSQ